MGLDQAAAFESVEGRIERALLDAQHVARHLLHSFGDGPTMLRTEGNCSENEQIQRSLWKVDMLRQGVVSPASLLQVAWSAVEVQGEMMN